MLARSGRLCVLLSLIATFPGEPGPTRSHPAPPPLLVAVEPAGGTRLLLHPVAIMADSGLADLGLGEDDDSTSARFAAAYFHPGQVYHLAAAGRFLGTAQVDSTASAGCVGMVGLATGSVAPGLSPDAARLATTAPPSWTAALSARPLSAHEQATFQRLLADTLRALGTAAQRVRAAKLDGAVYVAAGADTAVLLAVLNTPDTAATGIVASALVLAEVAGSRTIRVLTQVPDSLEFAVHSRSLVDAFDLDRDGWPEILVKDTYSESADYTVYRRRNGRWIAWYHGGGGGC